MAQPHQNWTTPVVCHHGYNMRKEWYIFFRFYYKGNWKDIKKRGGINFFHDKKERKANAEALREARENWLKMDWNPVLDPDFKNKGTQEHNYSELKKMDLWAALDFALEKHHLADKSRYDYSTTVRVIKHAAMLLKMDTTPIVAVTRVHVKALMDTATNFTGKYLSYYRPKPDGRGKEGLKQYYKKEKWSEKSYNKNLQFLSALFTEVIQWEALEFNPAYKIAHREEPETEKFIPLTIPKLYKRYSLFLRELKCKLL